MILVNTNEIESGSKTKGKNQTKSAPKPTKPRSMDQSQPTNGNNRTSKPGSRTKTEPENKNTSGTQSRSGSKTKGENTTKPAPKPSEPITKHTPLANKTRSNFKKPTPLADRLRKRTAPEPIDRDTSKRARKQ